MKNCAVSKRSFTLVEMLIVTSLIAVIGAAVFHSLANGLKIWAAATGLAVEEDVVIFFDKLSQDLHNATDYSLLKFEGRGDRVSFATIVRTIDSDQSSSAEYLSQIGRVEYEFDSLRHVLLRRQAGYGQALQEKFDPARPLVETITAVKFFYYVMDSNHIVRKDSLRNDQWPVAVSVEVTLPGKGENSNTMSKVIFVPSGNLL